MSRESEASLVIGSGIVELRLGDCASLKEKRSVLQKIISRIKGRFNVSVAEIGANDDWRRALIGIGVIGSDRRYVSGLIDQIVNQIETLRQAELVFSKFEITSVAQELRCRAYEDDKYD